MEAMRQACIQAALGELLTDKTGTSDDEAYNRAVRDVISAMQSIDDRTLSEASIVPGSPTP